MNVPRSGPGGARIALLDSPGKQGLAMVMIIRQNSMPRGIATLLP